MFAYVCLCVRVCVCVFVRACPSHLQWPSFPAITSQGVYPVVARKAPSICQLKSSFRPDVKHVGELISRCYEEKTYCVWLTHPLHLLLDTVARRAREAPGIACHTAGSPTPCAEQHRHLSSAHVMKGFYLQVMKADTKYNLMHSKTVSASSLH